MKIITDNAAYVQEIDLAYLSLSRLQVPISIRIRGGIGGGHLDNTNKYKFYEFTSPKEISFFRNTNWILDYDEVKDLSDVEIIQLGEAVVHERNSIALEFNAMAPEVQRQNYDLVDKCSFLEHKAYSLEYFLEFKHGKVKTNLPDGIGPPSASENKVYRK